MKNNKTIFLTKTSLSGYKSIENVSIDFVNGLNIILGKNAVGKTNFLTFLNNSLNFKFTNSNNFDSSFTIKNKNINYDFSFTKKTHIQNTEKEKYKLFQLKNILSLFNGKLTIQDKNNTTKYTLEIKNESEANKFNDQLKLDNIYLKSIFIRHGLPKNYYIVDKPLNIDLFENNIADDFFNLYSSETQTNFVKRILFSTLTLDILDKKYFNKRLRKKESIDKFISQKVKEYKNEVISDLIFLNDLKAILKEYSPIEDIKINENFLIDIDIENHKITLRNFFLEFYIDNKWYNFEDLSDGTKRIFYIISEIFILDNEYVIDGIIHEETQIHHLNIIFIEEPELGIHPHQLYNLMRFIKEKSQNNQIIITTHSPLSLNILEKDELSSIIIANKLDGKTVLHKLNKEKLNKAKLYMDDLDLSDFWINSNLED